MPGIICLLGFQSIHEYKRQAAPINHKNFIGAEMPICWTF